MSPDHSPRSAEPDATVPVLIVGAGPIGMLLALELARYEVPTLLFDSASSTRRYPKGNTHNSRTMEHYRRLGLVERIRGLGLPPEHPTDVAYFTRILGPELARIPLPSTSSKLASAESADDLAQVIEPIHRANQMYVEEVLAEACANSRFVTVRRGCQVEEVSQDADGVDVKIRDLGNDQFQLVRAGYVIGCDGGRSTVRQSLGISYEGEGAFGTSMYGGPMTSGHLRITGLRDRLRGREFWQGWTINPEIRTDLFPLDGQDEYMIHCALPDPLSSVELGALVGRALGQDHPPVEVLSVNTWTAGRALVATRFMQGRVMLCGDAAHLFTPTGGFGMNTGIDDAANLAWKLAAVIHGWGGAQLLGSYETERLPIAIRNTSAARMLAKSVQAVQIGADIEDPGSAGDAERRRVGAILSGFREEFDSIGVQLGARYERSPIVISESTPPPPDRPDRYDPSARPGGRLPHLRLRDGSSLFDRLGHGYTLVRTDTSADVTQCVKLAAGLRIPLSVVDVEHPQARDFYEASLVLVRPDQHVAWRGERIEDPNGLLAVVTGHHEPVEPASVI
jgi:2-polyprenyl-6-methoxyphenol hydroxylase-like FAD-dependent oxidoreductase